MFSFDGTMQIFAVYEEVGNDDAFPGYVSVWRNRYEAEEEVHIFQDMYPENFYCVHVIEEPSFPDFWFHNQHLTLA